MYIAQKDARFRICPLLATPDGKMRFCQGSQCMMWRWQGEQSEEDSPGFCGLAQVPVGQARQARAGFLSVEPKAEPKSPFD